MIYKDRIHAGRELAKTLVAYRGAENAIVLALPRGGVVVGAEVAKALDLPLDIVVPRKIGAPGNPEYAIGAVAETGERIMNPDEVRTVNPAWLEREIKEQIAEAQRRIKTYRGDRPPLALVGKTVIIIDDGVATGFTMRAAIASVRAKKPSKIIVAVPHGARESVALLRREADEIVVLQTPIFYGAVGAYYEEFPQTSDEEVITILKAMFKSFKDSP